MYCGKVDRMKLTNVKVVSRLCEYISVHHKDTGNNASRRGRRGAYARPISIQLSLCFFYDSYLVPVSPPPPPFASKSTRS